MRNRMVDIEGPIDYASAKKAALEEANRAGIKSAEIIAWHDSARNVEGPLETCAEEGGVCAREFAEHHGASLIVSINEGEYEFFFCDVSSEFSELDREEALGVHANARRDEFDDVQGG